MVLSTVFFIACLLALKNVLKINQIWMRGAPAIRVFLEALVDQLMRISPMRR